MQKETEKITLDDVRNNELVEAYITRADEYMEAIGYTEHGKRHSELVANRASIILMKLGRSKREAELSAIAGYLHDIGNVVNRQDHAYAGAVLAHTILVAMGMHPREVTEVVAAIGNHDEEETCDPISAVAAGLILADKSDVHRSRVRNPDMIKFDIHDRVNYAVENSILNVDEKKKTITLQLSINTDISQVMEYFEIFLSRMILSRRAAAYLSCQFKLVVNGIPLL